MFEQTRVLNALLPPCALVAVADLVAEPQQRRLSVTRCGREGTYQAAESLNPPSPPQPAPRAATGDDAALGAPVGEAADGGRDTIHRHADGYRHQGSASEGEAVLTGPDTQPEGALHESARFADEVGPDADQRGASDGEHVVRSSAYDAVVRHLNWQFDRRADQPASNQQQQTRDGAEGAVVEERERLDQGPAGSRKLAQTVKSLVPVPRGPAFRPQRQRDTGEQAERQRGAGDAETVALVGGSSGPRLPEYAHSLKRSRKFQSTEGMQRTPAAVPRSRLHLSTPDLSASGSGRVAAPPVPCLVAPPPPSHPPPDEPGAEPAVYDAPRPRGKMSVTPKQWAAEMAALQRDNERLRRALLTQPPEATTEPTERERRRQGSLRTARRRADALERELDRLTEANRRLAAENDRLRAQPGREDGAVLRQLVVRLSEQLARRQGRPPPDAADTPQLSDTRRLPPLLDAYDQVQAELSEQADALRADRAELRRQLDGLTAENESLHSQLADAQSKPGVTHQEWRSVSENARLVLEENQLLKQQAQILKDKQSEAEAEAHRQETAAAARVADLERSAAELRSRLQGEGQLRDQLAAERDRLQLQLQDSVPREQHNSAVAECRRLFEELRSRYTSERLSLLADTEALQAERRRLVVQLTDAATQRAASETKLRAANKSITRLERRVSSLQGDLESAQKANSEASEHLAEVLSATDQLMAERSQMARLSTSQMTDGDRLLEKISEERAHSLRLKDKVKAVRDESQQQLEQMRFEMGDQTRSHESRLAEYERQLAYLRFRLNDKQLEADHLRAENRRISEEMSTLSRAATAENLKLKEQLQHVPERDSSSSGGRK